MFYNILNNLLKYISIIQGLLKCDCNLGNTPLIFQFSQHCAVRLFYVS